jgi:hypothetical protein
MGLLDVLRRKAPASPAKPESVPEIVAALVAITPLQVHVLGNNPHANYTGDRSNTAEFQDWIRRNAEALSEQQDFTLYERPEGDRKLVPFFTSQDALTAYVKSDPEHAWMAFTSMQMSAANLLFKYLAPRGESTVAVKNARSPDEQRFTTAELRAALPSVISRLESSGD